MEIEKRLYEAAAEGDVLTLHELIQHDSLLLDRLTITCFTETPLHIAALDFRKSSALHVASIKGYVEIVKELLVVNSDMCLE